MFGLIPRAAKGNVATRRTSHELLSIKWIFNGGAVAIGP